MTKKMRNDMNNAMNSAMNSAMNKSRSIPCGKDVQTEYKKEGLNKNSSKINIQKNFKNMESNGRHLKRMSKNRRIRLTQNVLEKQEKLELNNGKETIEKRNIVEPYIQKELREDAQQKIDDNDTDSSTSVCANVDINAYDNFLGAPQSWERLEKNSGWYLIKTVNNFEFYFNILTNERCWQRPEELQEIMYCKEKSKIKKKKKERKMREREIETEIEIYSDCSVNAEDDGSNENQKIMAILHSFKDMLIEKNVKKSDKYENILPSIQYDIRFLSVPAVVRKQCFYLLLNKIHTVKLMKKKEESVPPKKVMSSLIKDLKGLLRRTEMGSWCYSNEQNVHLMLQNEKEYIGNGTKAWKQIRELIIKEYAKNLIKRKEMLEDRLNGFLQESEYLINPKKRICVENSKGSKERYKMIYIDECVNLFNKKVAEICPHVKVHRSMKKKTHKENDNNESYKKDFRKCEEQENMREWKRVKIKLEHDINPEEKLEDVNIFPEKEMEKDRNEEVENIKNDEMEKNRRKEVEQNKERNIMKQGDTVNEEKIDSYKEKQIQKEIEVMMQTDEEIKNDVVIRKESELKKDVTTMDDAVQKENEIIKKKNMEGEAEMDKKKNEVQEKEGKMEIEEENDTEQEYYISKEHCKEIAKCKDTSEWLTQKLHTNKVSMDEKQKTDINRSEPNDGTKMLFLLFANVECPVVNEVLLRSGDYEEKECFDKVFNIPESMLNNKLYQKLSLSDNEKFQVYKHFVIGFTKTKLNIFTERIKSLPINYINQSLKEILKKIDKTGTEFAFLNYKCMHNTYLEWKKKHIKILEMEFQEYLNDYDFTKYDFNLRNTYNLIMEHMSTEQSYQLLQCAPRERYEMICRQIKIFKQKQAAAALGKPKDTEVSGSNEEI